MRAPGEVMAENRPSPVSDGHLSPSQEKKGMGRAQLSIQELQDLAERQRKQILYSSKELMDKQQQLMRMHNDFRTRLKIENGTDTAQKNRRPRISDNMTPSPRRPSGLTEVQNSRGQDQYAKMLRETYHNMGRLQNRSQLQKEIDIKKLNNVELAHELKKVRAIFSSKQNELAEAVKKVDVLTHELEKRKHGDSGASAVPTPERINRRKKIQAAKDELDRLRNELIVRNEMNSQQSHQLQLQRDIIHEKQQELRELNSRINELGNALLKQQSASSSHIQQNYAAMNGYQQRLFNAGYLYDTLNRKRIAVKPVVQHINDDSSSNVYNNSVEDVQVNNNFKIPIDTKQSVQIHPDLHNKSSSLNSPSSPISHSSISSASITTNELSNIMPSTNDNGPSASPSQAFTLGGAIDKNGPTKPYDDELLSILKSPVQNVDKLKKELNDKPYSDSTLSGDFDNINLKYEQYSDATSSYTFEMLQSEDKNKKAPPPIKPKPKLSNPKSEEDLHAENKAAAKDLMYIEDETRNEEDHFMLRPNEKQWASSDIDLQEYIQCNVEQHNYEKTWPLPSMEYNGPTEPDEFELSFADIDKIDEIQTDLWSNSDSTMSNNDSIDSDFEDISKAIVPVVISISPDRMPPPILMKPEKPRKEKRNVVLDPFILLLDAALEGEMETVKGILRKVPDPSQPNPEGITALHNAVCGNHKDVVRYLVEVACDINSADNNGWTPLHCAAFYNDTDLCKYLVEHGASVFATTYTDYQTPAHKCSRLDENYDACFGYLHECKENVGRFNNGLVHSLYDYIGENEDELSFTCGEELTVLRRGDTIEKEWWWARNRNGETGYLPCNLIGNYPRIAAVV